MEASVSFSGYLCKRRLARLPPSLALGPQTPHIEVEKTSKLFFFCIHEFALSRFLTNAALVWAFARPHTHECEWPKSHPQPHLWTRRMALPPPQRWWAASPSTTCSTRSTWATSTTSPPCGTRRWSSCAPLRCRERAWGGWGGCCGFCSLPFSQRQARVSDT